MKLSGINSITESSNLSIVRSQFQLKKSCEELSTGKRIPSENLAVYILGSRLQDKTKILTTVVKNVGYGVNLVRTAQVNLISIKDNLIKLKTTIVHAANLQDGPTLNQLNTLYISGVNNIIKTLSTTFCGIKLFDGSFAIPANVEVAEELIPKNANPFNIRVGESCDNTKQITIPRLLSGRGDIVDIEVEGRFTPLFPIIDVGALAPCLAINLINDVDPNTTNTAVQNLPVPHNPIAATFVQRAKQYSLANVLALNHIGHGATPLIRAIKFKNTIIAQALVSIGINNVNHVAHHQTTTAINNAGHANSLSAIATNNAIQGIVGNNRFLMAAKAAAQAIIGTVADDANGAFALRTAAKRAILNLVLAPMNVNFQSNILTIQARIDADRMLNNAINIASDNIAKISSLINSLEESINNNYLFIQCYDDAANLFLNTNYEVAAARFQKALTSTIAAISILQQIASIVRNSILSLINNTD